MASKAANPFAAKTRIVSGETAKGIVWANPFMAKTRVISNTEPAKPTPALEPPKPAPKVQPALTNAKAMRQPIVPVKKARQVRRLPGQKLLKRMARIEHAIGQAREDAEAKTGVVATDLDDATIANLHGAIGDIIERMKGWS